MDLVDGRVIRCAKVTGTFPREAKQPLSIHFLPSTLEKERARASGSRTAISVYDEARTTAHDARSMMAAGPAAYVAFRFSVQEALSIAVPGMVGRLRIFEDPDGCGNPAAPGASGHCGLEGVGHTGPGDEPWMVAEEIRARLGRICESAD